MKEGSLKVCRQGDRYSDGSDLNYQLTLTKHTEFSGSVHLARGARKFCLNQTQTLSWPSLVHDLNGPKPKTKAVRERTNNQPCNRVQSLGST
jgi:hypothetical protein